MVVKKHWFRVNGHQDTVFSCSCNPAAQSVLENMSQTVDEVPGFYDTFILIPVVCDTRIF